MELDLLAAKADETHFTGAIKNAANADQAVDLSRSSFRQAGTELEVFAAACGKLSCIATQLGGNLADACGKRDRC